MTLLFSLIPVLAVYGWMFLYFRTIGLVLILLLAGIGLWNEIALKKAIFPISEGIVFLMVAVSVLSGTKIQLWGGYNDWLQSIGGNIEEGRLDEASESIDTLCKLYGDTDKVKMMQAYLSQTLGDYESAISFMDSVNNRNNEDWYHCKESIYQSMGSLAAEETMEEFYKEASDALPKSAYYQMMRGTLLLKKDDLKEAAYYLKKAYALDNSSCTTTYYLGVAAFKQGDYKKATYWFDISEGNRLKGSLNEKIKWYRNEIEEEKAGNAY